MVLHPQAVEETEEFPSCLRWQYTYAYTYMCLRVAGAMLLFKGKIPTYVSISTKVRKLD